MTEKKETSVINNLFIYGLSCMASVLFMMLYWYEPIYTFVKENITYSNIVPYAMFVILFVICQIVFQIMLKNVNLNNVINKLNPIAAFIIAGAVVLGYAWLLLQCYLREVDVFDGPSETELLYHVNEKITIMILVGIFAISVYAVANMKLTIIKNMKMQMLVYIFAVTIGGIYFYSLFTPNCYLSYYNTYHIDAYFNSVYSAMNGIARSELNSSVYGFYGILIAPFVKILGGNLTAFYYVICSLALCSYLCVVYIIVNLVRNDAVKIAGIIALVVTICSMHRSIYLQLIPHRILFSGFLTAYILFGIKHGFDRKIWFQIVGYIICALSIIWNFETGIVLLVAYSSYFIVRALKKYKLTEAKLYLEAIKLIVAMIITVISAWLFVGIVNVCMKGDFLSFKTFIFPLINSHYMDVLTYDYQKNIVAWLFIAVTAFLFISNCLSKTNLNPKGAVDSKKDAFMFVIAVIVLGQMTYYINRPAYGNLTIAYTMSVIMMCVVCDYCIYSKLNEKNGLMKILYIGFGGILLTVLVALCLGGVYNYSSVQQYRQDNLYSDTSEIEAQEEEIKNYCKTDTKAMGFTIPMLYSDLGWDSQYYLIDFADLGVYPDSYKYISNELNNNLNEPVLLDEYVFEDLKEEGIDVTQFLNKFEVERVFALGDAQLFYFVPKK